MTEPKEVADPVVTEVAVEAGDGNDIVVIAHAKVPGAYGEVKRSTMAVWGPKGWKIVDDDKIDPNFRRPSTPTE